MTQEATRVAPDAIVNSGLALEPKQMPTAGRWQPGQSGNPAGRPKKGNTFGEKMRAELDKIKGPGSDATGADALVRHALRMAMTDEPHAVRWFEALMDRTEGKVTVPIEVANVTILINADDDVP